MPPITIEDPITMADTSTTKKRYEMSGEGGKTERKIGPRKPVYRIIVPIPKMQACPKGHITLSNVGELRYDLLNITQLRYRF